MSILFVSTFALFRDTRFGGSKRLYYLARELERTDDLYIICLDSARELGGRDPTPEFRNALFLHDVPDQHPPGSWRLPFDMTREIEAQRTRIERFLGAGRFDGVYLAYSHALSFLPDWILATCRNRVYSEDDLVLEYYRKQWRGGGSGLKRLYGGLRYLQATRFFRGRLRGFQDFLAISREETELAKARFPWLRVHVTVYGLPLEEYPQLPSTVGPKVLGFIGGYRHAPNLDALEYLLKDVFPFLREKDAGISLVIAGEGIPEDRLERYRKMAGVTLLGRVENLEEFYGRIGIFINPIVTGRGMRTKLIEAAAFGRPIISTALGAEGLDGLEALLAEDGPAFLQAIERLSNRDEWNRLAQANRKGVEEFYSLTYTGARLKALLKA